MTLSFIATKSMKASPLMLISALAVITAGCAFYELREEIAEIEGTFAIAGDIDSASPTEGSVVVLLFEEMPDGFEISQYTIAEETGFFSFLVGEGTYVVGAFEDTNNNLVHDRGETAGFALDMESISIPQPRIEKSEKNPATNLLIDLAPMVAFPDHLPENTAPSLVSNSELVKLGRQATLDDDIFKPENGNLGYWKPLTFLKQLGFGIYFLEPYDPGKIPVLFIHGANGTPAGWKPLAEAMDRKKFQPWFYYYPSGFRLEEVAGALNRLVQKLHTQFGFDTLYVTAHSMGGLVARSFIQSNAYGGGNAYITLFISMSTPWSGHRMAAKGVKSAPAAIPSWHDVVPGSAFIASVFEKPLPSRVQYHLLFSHRGNCSMWMENNDGAVELASVLDGRAQDDAVKMVGYDVDHETILSSPDVLSDYAAILEHSSKRHETTLPLHWFGISE
jgi:pimeloyl-ACP methyl ester carboxylesterase